MQSASAFSAPAAVSLQSSFVPRNALSSRSFRVPTVARPSRRADVVMVSQTNIAKKAAKVAAVVEKLQSAELIFAADAAGISVKDMMELKNSLPESTTVSVVKNTLMRRAIADSNWEAAGDFTDDSNMWFFVGEEANKTVKAYEDFIKTHKREDLKGGIFEGTKYDGPGITAIAALPSKLELITKVALAVKMVPTKLGRSVNAIPTKVARAIKLAVADEDSGDEPAAE